jgi:uncharacterized protein (TIGR03118 family)
MSLPLFRKNRASDWHRAFHPGVECLEDRYLLSAGFAQVNLASDLPGLARVIDPNLVNPWGIAFSPTGPFWFANNGSGVSDLLNGRGQAVPLVVSVPSRAGGWTAGSGGTPTGTVFNGGAGFIISENGTSAPSRFLFATADGTIAGWTTTVDPTHALLVVDSSPSGAIYTGLALAADSTGHSFLFAADFSSGTIDVFDQEFRPVVRSDAFQDPTIPNGFAPFNIQLINDLLFVTYAQQDESKRDDVAGAGLGFIDVYNTDGSLVRRFASQGALNSPWGLAMAPADFGPYSGALLVGNNGDGRISGYDPRSGAFLGELADDGGVTIAIPNLWALTFGNGHAGGDSGTLFFAAGLAGDDHGLFGAIQAPGRQGADTGGAGTFDPHASGEPDDYPLPPSGGPALRDSGAGSRLPTAAVLPLREFSLALIPTLSPAPLPSGLTQTPPPTAALDVSFSASVPTSASDSTIALIPAAGDSQPANAATNGVVALNTFFNLYALRSAPQKNADAAMQFVDAPGSRFAESDPGAEALLAGVYADRPEDRWSEQQSAGTLPPLGLAGEMLSTILSASYAKLENQHAVGNESVETKDSADWKHLVKLFFAVSIPTIWTYWLNHHTRPRQSPSRV